jgi:hypothetical protein
LYHDQFSQVPFASKDLFQNNTGSSRAKHLPCGGLLMVLMTPF